MIHNEYSLILCSIALENRGRHLFFLKAKNICIYDICLMNHDTRPIVHTTNRYSKIIKFHPLLCV